MLAALDSGTMNPTPPKPTPARPLVEVNTAGLRALVNELGVADTARFLHQFGPGRGDYTAERDDLLGDPGFEEAVEWVRRHAVGTEA